MNKKAQNLNLKTDILNWIGYTTVCLVCSFMLTETIVAGPRMIAFGYQSCTVCHVNQEGKGQRC